MTTLREAAEIALAALAHPNFQGAEEAEAVLRAALQKSRKAERETTFKISRQGDVRFSHCQGYMLLGDGNAVCFFIDPTERAYPMYSTTGGRGGCPVLGLETADGGEVTEIEFPEFPGWGIHAVRGGKSIAVSLTRRVGLDEGEQ